MLFNIGNVVMKYFPKLKCLCVYNTVPILEINISHSIANIASVKSIFTPYWYFIEIVPMNTILDTNVTI